jgi:hypothetical protein
MEAYLEYQRREFLADPEFSSMRLSDANAVGAAAASYPPPDRLDVLGPSAAPTFP